MMAEKVQITDQLVEDCVVRAIRSVFHTMVGKDVKLLEQIDGPPPAITSNSAQLIGSVGFLGAANGLIYLCFSEEFAKVVSGHILGMSPSEIEMSGQEVVHDAIGEITNMTVGGFKNALCDLGFHCRLTLPTIVRGHKLSIASIKAASRHVFSFDCSGHRLISDIQLKIEP